MKKTLASLFLLLAICLNSKATNYYIAASGNDANNGTSTSTPWKTLGKLNSFFSSLKAGDNVYLNRGDVFYGSITVNKSGSSGSPITIGAYGSGANPVVTGFTTVSAWTNLGGNIWESTSAISTLSSCNMVLVNGVNIAMGRYPNTGYLTYQSGGSNTSLTSSSLTSTNWTGAEAVIRKNDWVLDRCKITNYSGTTLTYSDPYTTDVTIANYGFFIQNDPRTLDAQNEWYYNPSTKKIRIYSTSIPANVQVATQANLLYDNGFDYITIDNISFTGSSNDAVYLNSSSDYCHIQNCNISFCGQNGIYLIVGNNSVLDNNLINNCNRAGIENDGGTGNTISNNTISNIGVVIGQSFDASHNDGIYASSSSVVIKYNTISNVSYNGIFISYAVGTGTVQYNFIDSTNMVLDDGGGIYTAGTEASIRTIDHNIVINTMGNREGTNNLVRTLASGIYLDEPSSNITVTSNTVANSLTCGIKMHRANSSIVKNNTLFNNATWQIYFQNATSTAAIFNNVLRNNIFFSKASSQWTLGFVSITNDIPSFGTADSNYYARPIDDNITLSTYQTNTSYVNRTLASWQSFTGQDAHSHKSPKTITNVSDLRFEYNPTSSNKTISLDANYIDVRNVSYNGTITLAPYTSAVLIKNGASTTNQPPTANAGPDQTIILPTGSVTLSGSGTDPNGSISAYNWTQTSGPSQGIISNASAASTIVTGLLQGIYQFQLKVTDNNGATDLDTVQITVNTSGNTLIANAGSDQSITLPTSIVTLSGSGTDTKGTISSYYWTKISGPSSFAISSNVSAVTNVTAMVQGIYLFQLKITDNNGATDLDTVQITVNAAGTTLLSAVSLANPVNGLNYKYYEGGFNIIPAFSALTPVKTGTSTNFDISLANRTTFFSFNFTGYINVPADGQYTFYTTSDDGSNLYIDNVLIVNNDGLHGAIEKSGTIGLAAGKHAISVGYIQSGVNKSLSVSYAGPGISKLVIPSSSLYISSTSGSNIISIDNNSNQTITSSPQINLKVYPNPFVNNINVNINSQISGIYKLILIDAIGRVILTTAGNKPPGTFQQSINTSSLQKGIYFLKVIQNDKESVVKLLK